MSTIRRDDVDVIRELRLRRWARENYVPESERGRAWHPIVLDEMRLRDDEIRQKLVARVQRASSLASAYVPLAPTSWGEHTLHPPHAGVPEPNLLRHSLEIISRQFQ
jgi:hypothetical protein